MKIHLLALVSFVLFLSTQIGVPVLPRLSSELGANAEETALILSAALMTLVALQFVSGFAADRLGRRAVLVGGAALGAATSALSVVVPDWHQLLLLRVLGGAADAIAMPALLGLTAEISAGRRGAFFGILRSSQGLSFIVAPSIGGFLSLYSLRLPFLADALFSFVACAVLFFGARGASAGEAHALNLAGVGRVFSGPRVHAFALFAAVNNFAFPILSMFAPIKAAALGYSPWQIAILLGLEAVGFTLASFAVGRLSDRFGRRPFVLFAQPLVLLSAAGLSLADQLPAMVVWYTLFGLAGGTTFLLGLVMMADVTPAEHTAATLGIFDSAIDLVILIAPPIGLLFSAALGRDPAMALAGLPALFAFIVALRVRETRPVPALGQTISHETY